MWLVSTGENIEASAGSDGTPNAIIAVAVTTTSITNVNFGADHLPTADAKTTVSIPNSGGTNRVTVPALTGSDPEDDTYTCVTNANTVVVWTFDNSDNDFYVFTTTEAITGKGHKSFGLTGVLTPGSTKGTLTINTTLAGGIAEEYGLTTIRMPIE